MTEERFLELRQSPVAGGKRHYETMQALLMAESPRYRQAFNDRLLSRLSQAFPAQD